MIPIQNSPLSSTSTATSGVATAARRAAAAPSPQGGAAPTAAPGGEQVSISGAGQLLQLASTQGATPPASDARIAALQSAIQSGQYLVDPQRIASGLLQDSRAMLGATAAGVKPGAGAN